MGNQAGHLIRDVSEAIDTTDRCAEAVRFHFKLFRDVHVSGSADEIHTALRMLNAKLATLKDVIQDAQAELLRNRY